MRNSLLLSVILISAVASADTNTIRSISVAEVQGVRLEIEQPLRMNELQIRVHDFAARNHGKDEVTCDIYDVLDGKESKRATLVLKGVGGRPDVYSAVYTDSEGHVHGSIVKVVYKSVALQLPLSTWYRYSFH